MVFTRDIPRIFDDFFFNWPEQPKPPMEVYPVYSDKNELQEWKIQMALAGFSEEDVKVWSEQQLLCIKGDNSKKLPDSRFTSSFKHKFNVSKDLDLKKTLVSLQDGLLTISIPVLAKKIPKKNKLFGLLD